jgi:hypothetical protein
MTSVNSDNQGKKESLRNLVIVEPDQVTILIGGVYEIRTYNGQKLNDRGIRRLPFGDSFYEQGSYLIDLAEERGRNNEHPYIPLVARDLSNEDLPFIVEPHFDKSYPGGSR